MRTAGRFSNDSSTDGDKRANVSTSAYEHTVSRPDVDSHAGTYACSDEFAHCHSDTDFDAVGNGYTHPVGHADSHEHTFSNTGTNSDECSNSHINSRDVGDIVAYTRPHCYASPHKLAHVDTDGTTHGYPYRHVHTDSRSYRDPHVESHSTK
ncbi:MAG: hypothetical protein OXK79_00275 [Chloroflexota bacterium]|nr:hypothetical protein [Chloroflexota bacterium]